MFRRRFDINQSRDLAAMTREAESHICRCGQPLSNHEWDEVRGPMGGCPETGCKEFRLDPNGTPTLRVFDPTKERGAA